MLRKIIIILVMVTAAVGCLFNTSDPGLAVPGSAVNIFLAPQSVFQPLRDKGIQDDVKLVFDLLSGTRMLLKGYSRADVNEAQNSIEFLRIDNKDPNEHHLEVLFRVLKPEKEDIKFRIEYTDKSVSYEDDNLTDNSGVFKKDDEILISFLAAEDGIPSFIRNLAPAKDTEYKADLEFLYGEWKTLFSSLDASGNADEIFEQIVQKYTEEKRAYHTLLHIEQMLKELHVVRDQVVYMSSLLCAIWFHDIIYEPERDDNEERSAALAEGILAGMGLDGGFINRVCELIVMTETHKAPVNDIDCMILMDLDLAVIGSSDSIYELYHRSIREEYSFAKIKTYLTKRADILESFLNREVLYYIPDLRQKFENKARSNLKKSITWLRSANYLLHELTFPEGNEAFDPFDFLDDSTAIYGGTFENFGELEKDIIRKAHEVYKKIFVIVIPKEKGDDTKDTVNEVYSQLEGIDNVVVCGSSSKDSIPSLANIVESKTLIRKLRSIPDDSGKLEYEARIAEENYTKFGLETVFTIPSNEHLTIEEDLKEMWRGLCKSELKRILPEGSLKNVKDDLFSWIDVYKKWRAKILEGAPPLNKRIAFYAGSFYPITKGHMHVIERAAAIYDKLYVGVGVNSQKTYAYSLDERVEMVQKAINSYGLDNVAVVGYYADAMTVDEAAKVGAGTLIRGARSVEDLKMELPYAWINGFLDEEMDAAVVVPYDMKGVSSSLVRGKIEANEDISDIVPGAVYWRMNKDEILKAKGNTKIIGLVSGIASGKSTVLECLNGYEGTFTIDLDKVAHECYENEDVLKDFMESFGEGVFTDGKVDFKKLGAEIFGNNRKLNVGKNILYPHLFRKVRETILDILQTRDDIKTIVIEGIGFVDEGMGQIADEVWYIDAPEEMRVQRIVENRKNRTEDYAWSVINMQRSTLKRARKSADVIIKNFGRKMDLYDQILDLRNDMLYPEDPLTASEKKLQIIDLINSNIEETRIIKEPYVIKMWDGYGAPGQESLLTKIRSRTKDGSHQIGFEGIESLVSFACKGDNVNDRTVTVLPLDMLVGDQKTRLDNANAKVMYINLEKQELDPYDVTLLNGLIAISRAYLNNNDKSFYELYEILTDAADYEHIALERLKEEPDLFIKALKFLLKPITANSSEELTEMNKHMDRFLMSV